MIPLLVMKVPKMVKRKVKRIKIKFQTFNIPLFSWIITECKYAVPMIQGKNEAFSTGSQAQ